ncbi:MAG: hypothetical protein RLY35_2075, partial [Bacteroidota bacterium]
LSWLERMIHNHEVEGSCPSLATTYNTPKPHIVWGFLLDLFSDDPDARRGEKVVVFG